MLTLPHAYAIVEVRSCLAALADTVPDFDASADYDRILIYFDGIVGDFVPAISPLDETDSLRLLARLEAGVEELVAHGFDGLTAELLLDKVNGAAESAAPG